METEDEHDNEDDTKIPLSIDDVTLKQRRQIIEQYSDMTCDLCQINLRTFKKAIEHYKVVHNNQPKGYVKCCQSKWSRHADWQSHILWHLNPEIFK